MPSNESDEILRQLNSDEVRELLELYKRKYGKEHFHYLLMYNQSKWNRNLEELGIDTSINAEDSKEWNGFRKAFYTHRDCDFRKFGTYVSLHYDTMQSVSFNSWEPGLCELYECLEKTNLIDWQSGPLLTNVYMEYCDRIKEIAASKGVGVQRARLCHGLIMPHEKALQLHIDGLPPGYEMQDLQIQHAEYIHQTWPNNKEASLDYVRGLLKVNKSLGIFRKTDNTLVAWIIQNDFSGLGFLQTLPDVQRRGFGYILAAELCKRIAKSEQVELSAWILIENFKSEALLEKVGFHKSVVNEWIQLKRNKPISKRKYF